jgi:DNA-binding response OmpR family regulator
MADNGTLLCIHRDPAQLSLLQENGYELVTAMNGSEGLRLLMTRSVDAIVLEYHLGLLDGATVATEIKKSSRSSQLSCLPTTWNCLTEP